MLHDLALTLPMLILLFGALFTLVADPFLPAPKSGEDSHGDISSRRFWGPFGAAVSAAALIATALLWKAGPLEMQTPAFAYHLSASKLSLFFTALVILCGLVTHLASPRYLIDQGCSYGEYYALVHFATFGMVTMVSAESILTLFIGLETMSLAVYVLAAFKRTSQASVEAGIKYFIMGSVASALLLYGMAFLYGISGGTSFIEIQRALVTPQPGMDLWLGLAVLLTMAAFLFKVAAVPFHMWAPDAYEGAPTPVAGFMSSAVKVTAFGALLKFLYAGIAGAALLQLHLPISTMLATLAVITMTVGNLLALSQRNIKRMLGYSAVAHAGYLLLGCVASVTDPVLGAPYEVAGATVPFYLVGYALASLAAFAALTTLGKDGEELTGEAQVVGMGRQFPLAGAVLALAMLSLAGVPPTLGFFGKLELLREVMAKGGDKYLPHMIILVLNSVVSAYYYLRVTVWVYMKPEGRAVRQYVREPSLSWAMGLTALAILALGALPSRTIGLAWQAGHGVRTAAASAHVLHAQEVLRGGKVKADAAQK